MLELNANITIGKFTLKAVTSVRVRKSILSFVDSCELELPTAARLKQSGELPSVSVPTAAQFNEGDNVSVELGYNGILKNEFVGFVKRVDLGTPCKVICEGYVYQLRKTLLNKTWKNAKIKDVLTDLIKGTDITIHPDTPDTSFEGTLWANSQTAAEVLAKMDKELFLTVYFVGSQLYVGPRETAQLNNAVNYRLGWNTIKDDQLIYRRPEDAKIRLKVTYKNAKGKTVTKTFGKTGGREEVLNFKRTVENMDWLKSQVNQKAREFSYAGYEGKLVAFLHPFAQHGWKAIIEDPKYAERDGSYLITAVDVQYGTRGGRRIIELGHSLKLNQDELRES